MISCDFRVKKSVDDGDGDKDRAKFFRFEDSMATFGRLGSPTSPTFFLMLWLQLHRTLCFVAVLHCVENIKKMVGLVGLLIRFRGWI